jgi:hypothetical protein
MANMYGIAAARFHKFPNVKEDGMFGMSRLIIFVSENASTSIDGL